MKSNNSGKNGEYEIYGYSDLYESKPEYQTVLYGNVKIPLKIIKEAVDNSEVVEIFGQEYVVFNVSYYKYTRKWNRDGVPPVLSGRVTRFKKKQQPFDDKQKYEEQERRF